MPRLMGKKSKHLPWPHHVDNPCNGWPYKMHSLDNEMRNLCEGEVEAILGLLTRRWLEDSCVTLLRKMSSLWWLHFCRWADGVQEIVHQHLCILGCHGGTEAGITKWPRVDNGNGKNKGVSSLNLAQQKSGMSWHIRDIQKWLWERTWQGLGHTHKLSNPWQVILTSYPYHWASVGIYLALKSS